MLFNRKGQGLPLNTIIIAIIVIVVLVVIILIFTGQIVIFGEGTDQARNECQKAFGICVSGTDHEAACRARGLTHEGIPSNPGCPENQHCCVVG
ncbi:MAG: hypothetical protein ACMXYL_05680 [Candidatus Woesearchaeota archaeon]